MTELRPKRPFTLESLIEAARKEDWNKVDRHLKALANKIPVLVWASAEGLSDPDGNVRDLAASIFEATATELAGETVTRLMRMLSDSNPFAGFRAACALFSHNIRPPEVIDKLREHENDEDEQVRGIARRYLAELG